MVKSPAKLHSDINKSYLTNESEIVSGLLRQLGNYDAAAVGVIARRLVAAVKTNPGRQTLVESFLREYQLNSKEGLVLMGIAEALLRIPDSATQDLFLQEKLCHADWQNHLDQSDSLLVNLSSHALQFTRQFEEHIRLLSSDRWFPVFDSLLSRMGAPLIRTALKQAMAYFAEQFVFAESIERAIKRCAETPDYRYSFDMLGEAAITADDADKYLQSYAAAIAALSSHAPYSDLYANPGISIKLSALCPRYEPSQHKRAIKELTGKLLALAKQARAANISMTVDAEESERLAMSLSIFANVSNHPDLSTWPGFGLAVQAYQKRALLVIRWLADLAKSQHKLIPIRLVKGAYWDSEIKRAQENGLSDYPVFTHKSATDLSYLACSHFILSRPKAFYPQFASHNAYTLAAIYQASNGHPGYELQRLHGMGEALYEEIIEGEGWRIPCRIYAPVGHYHELLPYLVRRLLENGANTSFVNQFDRPDLDIEELIGDPVERAIQSIKKPHIALPVRLYGEQRLNSIGLNLANLDLLDQLQLDLDALANKQWHGAPIINGKPTQGEGLAAVNPYNNRLTVGAVVYAGEEAINQAIKGASQAFNIWRLSHVEVRANCLLKAAELFEQHRLELVSLCVREGGRSLKDALAEVREAVDYCRYYAQLALEQFAEPIPLPGSAGEENLLRHLGRGVFVCISPWNFPIAIFTGQITAALVAGNTVIAKPANQAILTAMRCVELLHEAGIPPSALQFVPAQVKLISQQLLPDPNIAGIVFTGSTETARIINQQLANQHQAILPFIAETGGQNVMIADSSALLEQLVQDAATSAFNSAGQRCSALRVLFLQEEIADRTIALLIGMMRELVIGNPGIYSTDIGPVIDRNALAPLQVHLETMRQQAKILYQSPIDASLQHGSFFPTTLIEIQHFLNLVAKCSGLYCM